MGLYNFLSSSPFDSDVEKATNEVNTTEDWSLIMEICDKVNNNATHAKDCLRSIVRRLHNQDPHIVVQAVTLLDACVNNCGKTFQLEVASRDFEGELKKVVKKWLPSTTVGTKLRVLIKDWSNADFKTDPQLSLLPSMWSRFQQEGVDLSIPADPTSSSRSQKLPNHDTAVSQQEVDDIAKAIELSLKENSSPKTPSGPSAHQASVSSIYPSIGGGGGSSGGAISLSGSAGGLSSSELTKVRALYDFEAAEENELTFLAGEIIHVLDDSDANWWKGCNQRGEGLFPANFVTTDTTTDPQKLKVEKKGVHFNEMVEEKLVNKLNVTEIDEGKIDRVLHLLHVMDPQDDDDDPPILLTLEDEVMEMGPLIDAELETVDWKHAQLSQISASLVEAMQFYHSLMRDPISIPKPLQHPPGAPLPAGLYHTLPHSQSGPPLPHLPPGPQSGPPNAQMMGPPPPTQIPLYVGGPPHPHPPQVSQSLEFYTQPPPNQMPPPPPQMFPNGPHQQSSYFPPPSSTHQPPSHNQ